jgi:hypothetical protein
VNLDINKKSGGLGGIVSTYGKPAITKAWKSQNPQLACGSDKIGGRDAQIVKDNCMLHCLIRGSTNNFSAMDNGCLWLKSTLLVSNSRVVEFA